MAATFKNFATTKLTQNLSASATTAYVSSADAAKLPIADGVDSWFYLVIQRATDSSYFEIVKVTNKVDGTLTIVREQEGTIAKAFLLNDLAEARLTTMGLLDAFIGKSDWRLWAVTEAQFESERAINRRRFAASGYESMGRHYVDTATLPNINQGLFANAGTQNTLFLGRSKLTNDSAGDSKSYWPIVHAAGVLFEVASIANGNSNFIKFPQAPDGKTTYNKATGINTTHASASAAFAAQDADPTNVEVVTNRVDCWLKEIFPEEVSLTNPYIYPNGLLQSTATNMDGVATLASNRPESYYAFFDGDASSKGKGLNFFALTDAQKKKVLANPKNNLVLLNDGRLIQWRLRIRTFAGAGNGDWAVVETTVDRYSVRFSDLSSVIPQGKLEAVGSPSPLQYYYPSNNAPTFSPDEPFSKDVGAYQIRPASGDLCGVGAMCYALFGGTVNRLNQGAYHLSFNPSGTKFLQNISSPDGGGYWYLADQYKPTSTLECFTMAYATSGGISSAYSGRPDGRYYDAIYADGDGGVCRDMRYSAYGKTLEDFAEADQRFKNKEYRGFEKQIFTKIVTESFPSTPSEGNYIYDTALFKGDALGITTFKVGGYFYKYDAGVLYSSKIMEMLTEAGGNQLYVRTENPLPRNAGTLTICPVYEASSVGGSFAHKDVFGSPSAIISIAALANGWQGSWCDNTGAQWVLSRKAESVNASQTYTADGGVSWTSAPLSIDPAANAVAAGSIGLVWIADYKALAKATKPVENAKVLGGRIGVGSVFYSQIHSMSHISETFFGKVLNSWGPNPPYEGERVAEPYFVGRGYASAGKDVYWGKLAPFDDEYSTRHGAIIMGAPTSQANPAFKMLNYNVSKNQQATINYAYTELKFNGVSWGDDGKVAVFDNQSTKQDANGNTVLVGTARLREPLGWIYNNV